MATIDINVRRARPADAEAISQAHNAAWRNAYSGIISGQTLNRMIARRDSRWWGDAINNGANLHVVMFSEQIAGYASIRRNLQTGFRAMGEICELYLLPEFQGTGLGKRLFLEAKNAANRKFGRGCIVWALSANEPACRFYKYMGGKPVAKANEKLGSEALEKVAFLWP